MHAQILRTEPKPFVFVLMPFAKEFDDLYKLGIRPACEKAGAYCERVDEQLFEEPIPDRIYNQIAKADLLVAEMTGRNPNVFYETGYAHALGKRVILLTRQADDIPFDLRHYPHIIHDGSISNLLTELEKRVRWFIEHPSERSLSSGEEVQIHLLGMLLEEKKTIEVRNEGNHLSLSFDLHNPTSRTIWERPVELGLITSGMFGGSGEVTRVTLPDGRRLYIVSGVGPIRPLGWVNVYFELYYRGSLAGDHEFTIRVFAEIGVRDLIFSLRMKPKDPPNKSGAADG